MRLAASVLTALLALAACTAQVATAPVVPALPVEAVPLPPVSDQALVWQPGDWSFFNGSYRYEGGRYIPAAGHGNSWLPGHWVLAAQGQYAYVPGGWY